MSTKIKISKVFFKEILLDKLKIIESNLSKADNDLYSKEEHHSTWRAIRDANLLVDKLIDAIK